MRRFLVGAVAAAALLPATASASEWPLRGYWPLWDGGGQTVQDISGNRHHGQLGRTDSPDWREPEWISGLFGVGSALRMDGNDYVIVPETSSLRPQRMTLEAWVRAPKSPGQFKYVAVKGGDRCEAGSFGLYTSINGGMAFYVYDGSRWWRSAQVSQDIWDNRWHHVAGTYDGSAVHLYVDGREIGVPRRYSGDVEYDLEHRNLFFGAYRGACDLTFSGDVDEIRVWSAALRVDEIWQRITAMLDTEPAAPLPEDAGDWYAGP